MKNKTVVTFGTFDIFHVGHLRLLEKARAMGTHLIVGVSTDKLNFDKKGRYPVYSEDERKEIILSLKCVDSIFDEVSLEQKSEYLERYSADILVMGDDWEGKFDIYREICKVVYFQRTPAISTTEVIEKIRT
jgi:glycerol-3-phosphate cytidylyltransferase